MPVVRGKSQSYSENIKKTEQRVPRSFKSARNKVRYNGYADVN